MDSGKYTCGIFIDLKKAFDTVNLLFFLYINDIYKCSSEFTFYLFADDTSIIYANNNLRTLESTVNSELAKVSEWLKANKLTLNIKKSNYIIFRPRQKTMSFVPQVKIFNPMSNTLTSPYWNKRLCQISRNNDRFRPLVEESHWFYLS